MKISLRPLGLAALCLFLSVAALAQTSEGTAVPDSSTVAETASPADGSAPAQVASPAEETAPTAEAATQPSAFVSWLQNLFSGDGEEVFSLPSVTREAWNVGICEFEAKSLTPENSYLVLSIPLLLRERLAALPDHLLAEAERDGLRRDAHAAELQRLRAELATQLESDAATALREPTAAEASESQTVDPAEASRRHILWLSTQDPSLIAVPERLPLSFGAPEGDRLLYEYPFGDLDLFADESDLDFMIYGSLREIRQFIFIEVFAYDRRTSSQVFQYQDAVERDELDLVLPSLVESLQETLLGRPWADLRLALDSERTGVWLDGEYRGLALTELRALEPGPHELRFERPGYAALSVSVDLEAGRTLDYAVTLEALPVRQTTIVSDPAGASVFLEGQLQGTTPIAVDLPIRPAVLLLSLTAYQDRYSTLGPLSPEELSFSLVPAVENQATLLSDFRHGYYWSYGLLALSLPVTIFFVMSYQDLANAWTLTAVASEQNRLRTQAYVCLGGAILGAGLNITLLVRTIVRLNRYLEYAVTF